MSHRLFAFSLALAMLAPSAASAQSDKPPVDKTLSPYFVVEGGDPSVDRLPLKDTRVDVSIAGVIAAVTVQQVYENRGQRPIHARYVFPASTRAAVSGLIMTVGDVRTVAKIREREKAKREFDAAKEQGKSAALLEQDRPNVFTMRLANVMPGDTISVQLQYTELLVPTDGQYEFVYPTVVGPRYSSAPSSQAQPTDLFVKAPYTHEGELPRSAFHLSGVVSTGVPIEDLTSPSHRIVSRASGQGRSEVALDDADTFGGNRDFILRYRLAGREISSGLLLYEGPDENFFLLTAQPPKAVAADAVPGREYIFVIDVSGSMFGFPLNTAKKLMRDLIGVLRPSDHFNVILFEGGSQLFSRASVPATAPNLSRALQFIGAQSGGGGTELLSAVQRAVALPRQPDVSRTVVLVTDGYISAEADVFDYIRAHLHEANFFTFGVGGSVNRHLIEGVARAGQGEPFVVTGAPGDDESAEAASRFRQYIDSPVLTGIDVKFPGFDVYDVEPRQIPDLFASRPIVMFGKWRGPVRGSIDITGVTGAQPYRATIPVTPERADPSHAALRRLWARTRIANLSDFGPPAPGDDRIAEVTSLGLTYGLLTKYTSFIAVQEIVRRAGVDADDVDQPLPLPQGVSDLAVGVTSGDEPELLWLAVLLSGLLAVRLIRARAAAPGGVA